MSGVKRQKVFWDDGGETIKRFHEVDAVLASDYDRDTQALKAEVERLGGECEGCPMATAEELRIERDALRAQVEAMRAAPANERAAAFEACPESNCDWGAFYRGWMARAAMQAEQ